MRNRKIKIAIVFLACLLISYLAVANYSLDSYQQAAKSFARDSLQQTSDLFQHNSFLISFAKLQQNLNRNIAIEIKALKEQNTSGLLISISFIAFIYGILHAMGPGHGKSVISSWIISQQRTRSEVLCAAIFAAVFHALSAGLIVGGSYIVLGKFASVSTQSLNSYLQIIAAILVICIGLMMLVRQFQGQDSTQPSKNPQSRNPFFIALSIGIVPCPVTSVILIFCLTLGLIWQGILLVLSFAIGMGVSLIAVSLLIWSLKDRVLNKKLAGFQYFVISVLPIVGGILLIFFGSIILYSSL